MPSAEEYVTEDWAAVARTIDGRLTELRMTQRALATKAGVALSIVRELRHNTAQRRRSARTLEAVSRALGFHPRHLSAVAAGQQPPEVGDPVDYDADGILARLDAIEERLAALTDELGVNNANVTRMIDIVWPDHRR